MNKLIEIVRKTRVSVLKLTEGLTMEQLNKVPDGFNNNIIWNLGHMVAAQQGICYSRAGLPYLVSDNFFDTYKSGSKPERFITEQEFADIKSLMVSTIDQLEADLSTNIFDNYIAWTTRYDVEVTSVADAVTFLPYHEGLHMGYIMALKRVI